MTMQRKVVPARITALGDDEVEIIMSTAALARDGHILEPMGCVLDNYRLNPIQLWQHDPDHPVGNNENIAVSNDGIRALTRFAPLGISAKADEIRGLVKAGVIRAVSVSFDPIEGTPLDPKKPKGGQRYVKWELLECSFVSVPADTTAIVAARALKESTMNKDERAAAIATLRKGENAVIAGAPKPKFRGLYEVASLAYMVEQLGYCKNSADWESAVEGDDSAVPEMLGNSLVALGEALIAMTAEEVHELFETVGVDGEPDVEGAADITARSRAWRAGLKLGVFFRASSKTLEDMGIACRSALATHEEGMTHHRSAMRSHKRAMKDLGEAMERAGIPTVEPTGDDADSHKVQKSNGTEEDEGSRAADIDQRRRDADGLSLVHH